MAVFFSYLVGISTKHLEGDFGLLLRMRWLGYLGTISYGVYAIHMFTPLISFFLEKHLLWFSISINYLNVFLSVLLGAISWHLFENPIQKFKSFFPYEQSSNQTNQLKNKNAA